MTVNAASAITALHFLWLEYRQSTLYFKDASLPNGGYFNSNRFSATEATKFYKACRAHESHRQGGGDEHLD